MIFLPKKREILVSFLRKNLQKRIVKKGIDRNILNSIKKLNRFSLIQNTKFERKTDIFFLAKEVCTAISSRLVLFDYFVFFNLSGNLSGQINIPAFEELLCLLAINSKEKNQIKSIDICLLENRIEITAKEIYLSGYLKRIIKILGGNIITVLNKRVGIKIPVFPCEAEDIFTPYAADYILNPLSSVNLNLFDIAD